MRKMRFGLVVAVCCGLVLTTVACGTETVGNWTKLEPQGDSPSSRGGHSMVLDSSAGELILFGGWDGTTYLNDTWAYDLLANTWTELEPTGSLPTGRADHSMVFVPSIGRVILFGGGADEYLNDMWSYDPVANTWTELSPAGSAPFARGRQSMVYASQTGKVVLFGGNSDSVYENMVADTWEYDPIANVWAQPEPLWDRPSARESHAMIYDPAAARVILFGGEGPSRGTYLLNDIWSYDFAKNTWIELDPSGSLPEKRTACAMVLDPDTGELVLFGGWDGDVFLGDTWSCDLTAMKWTEQRFGGEAPPGRVYASMVFDPASGKAVLFGGWDGTRLFNDTWVYTTQER
ncbi:MAG: hypothetical protein JXA87_08160 [Thermoleophilia bacterium]|nr:hypothetical protein [Thermoleophilia bacterium]